MITEKNFEGNINLEELIEKTASMSVKSDGKKHMKLHKKARRILKPVELCTIDMKIL